MRPAAVPSCFVWRLLVILVLSLTPKYLVADVAPEAGAFFMKQYLPETYGGHPQNWAIVQDKRGVMYFGNTEGLLIYDGARWQKLSLPNGLPVYSLAVSEDGTIYVGGQGEIGYLKADALQSPRYISLLDQVPKEDRGFGSVWTTYCTKQGILFGSFRRIFRWAPATGISAWRPKRRFGRLFVADGTPYVSDGETGLIKIAGDRSEIVPGSEIFGASLPSAILPFDGNLLVATGGALYLQGPNGRFTQFKTDAEKLLQKFRIYSGSILSTGDLALGTVQGGVIVLNHAGQTERIIDKNSGLASNSVNGIYTDREGGMWLALAKGLARVDVQLPLTVFTDPEGLGEIVISLERHQGTLYAGTLNGLSRLVPSAGRVARFEPVSGFQGQVPVLLSTRTTLLVGNQSGLFEIDNQRSLATVFKGSAVYDLAKSLFHTNLLYAAGTRGLSVLRMSDGHWSVAEEIPGEGQDFRTVVEDSDGKVWVTTSRNIWRITPGTKPPTVEKFTPEYGFPAKGWKNAYRVRGNVVFATQSGLLRFDSVRKRFLPYSELSGMFADGSRDVYILRESDSGDVWISGSTYQGVLHHTNAGQYIWDQDPLIRSGIKQIYALHLDSNNVAWASGANGGLTRYQVWSSSVPNGSLAMLLRAVDTIRENHVLFGGFGQQIFNPRIPFAQNSLRFQFSSPSYEDETQIRYQTWLQGLDKGWSDWNPETQKEYTNLSNGRYMLRVRARDLHGRVSKEETYSFRVMPPWYRTWWAYLIYLLGAGGAISLLFRWRLIALEEANKRLEGIVAERTLKITQQRDEIKMEEEKTEALLLNILPHQVADELRSTGTVRPLAYDDITVCFTDFVGFTLSSEKISAPDLVAGLHKYFTAFDEIVDRYHLEKLKTIGDSYMFVSGLPDQKASHAVDAVLAALEIVEVVNEFSQSFPSWKIRIGIHSGSVIAGVVGVRKFAFDIWGETVNFASRFESSGWPNRVNISAETYQLVKEFIECEPRGLIRIKEGRQLEMYFARTPHRELLDDASDSRNSAFAKLYKKKFGTLPPIFPALKPELSMAQQAEGD